MKAMRIASLGLVALTVSALSAQTVLAADADAKTKSSVKFIKKDDSQVADPEKPYVVDPYTPDSEPQPVMPKDEGVGGNGKASFNINWVSNFRFGEVVIGQKMEAYAKHTRLEWAKIDNGNLTPTGVVTDNVAPFIQVTDVAGAYKGWHVAVKGEPFYQLNGAGQPDKTKELEGAAVYLSNPQIVGIDGADLSAPTANINTNSGTFNIINQSNATVWSAANKKGGGTWSMTWGAGADKVTDAGKGVKLVVPITAQPEADKTYQADLTWSLLAVPKN